MRFVVAHQSQTWAGQRQRAKFEVAPQQAAQPQSGGQVLSAQKIFVSERGILPDAHLLGVQHGCGQQQNIEVANLDRSSEGALELRNQVAVKAMRPRRERGPDLRGDQELRDRNPESPPFAYTLHDVRKFRRLPRKCKATRPRALINARLAAFRASSGAAAS